jgi:hypothetical protein
MHENNENCITNIVIWNMCGGTNEQTPETQQIVKFPTSPPLKRCKHPASLRVTGSSHQTPIIFFSES